jgi:hypothetical protein
MIQKFFSRIWPVKLNILRDLWGISGINSRVTSSTLNTR